MEQNQLAIFVAPSFTGEVTIDDTGVKRKAALLARAELITEVTDPDQRDAAVIAASWITAHLKITELDRKAIKSPYKAMAEAIDASAHSYVFSLKKALDDLNTKIGAFDKTERDRMRAVEAERQRLLQEAERERQETARKLQEATRPAPEPQEAVESILAPLQATPALSLREQLDLEDKYDQATEKVVALSVPSARGASSAGYGGRTTDVIELVSVDLPVLFAAHPHCVNMSVNRTNVKALIRAGINVPGVVFTRRDEFSAKA